MDKKEIEHLFELSKIEPTEEELEKFPKEFDTILAYVAKLKDAPLANIEPRLTMTEGVNILRPDGVDKSEDEKVTLLNEQFPESENRYLKTKKILGGE